MKWDPNTCSCRCATPLNNCPPGTYFDEECCECIVKPCLITEDCIIYGFNWYWNQYTCKCECSLLLTGELCPDGSKPDYNTCSCETVSGCTITYGDCKKYGMGWGILESFWTLNETDCRCECLPPKYGDTNPPCHFEWYFNTKCSCQECLL